MDKHSFREMLQTTDKKVNEAENVIARMFRIILSKHGVKPGEWENRMDRYYRRIHGNDVLKVAQEKTNLTRELIKNKLTWYRFETAIQTMGSKSYTFDVTIQYIDGSSKTYSRTLQNSPKGRKEDENILADFWHEIIASNVNDLPILPGVWEYRMDKYYRRLFPGDVQKIAQEKTNLTRTLAKNTVSWYRFESGLQVLGVESYTFGVTLHYANGQDYVTSIKTRNRFVLSPEELLGGSNA